MGLSLIAKRRAAFPTAISRARWPLEPNGALERSVLPVERAIRPFHAAWVDLLASMAQPAATRPDPPCSAPFDPSSMILYLVII